MNAIKEAAKEAELEEANELYIPSQKEIEAMLLQKRKEVSNIPFFAFF